MNVIIPTARVVPLDLQNICKVPPILYPINQKIMFDCFTDYYSLDDHFRLVCHDMEGTIKRRLKWYDGIEIEYCHVDQLRDLGYSIYCGIKQNDKELIIHFADTLIEDQIPFGMTDYVFYVNDTVSNKWTFFEIENGRIKEIIDKCDTTSIGLRKLFLGVANISHGAFFRTCLENEINKSTNESIDSFYRALCAYSEEYPMQAIEAKKWYDLGHLGEYDKTQLAVKERSFNHISIDRNRGILNKTSTDVKKFNGEIKWYLKIPGDMEYCIPRIFSYSIEYENPKVSMEYYSYHTLHELYLNAHLSEKRWEHIFHKICFIIEDFGRYRLRDRKIRSSLEDIYIRKLDRRLEMMRENIMCRQWFQNNIEVNQVMYVSLSEIYERIKKSVYEYLMDCEEFQIIHGDLCFTNIMIDNNFSFIKLIDPRGKFGDYDIYGDVRYELAKLLHCIDGRYDCIIDNLFFVRESSCKFSYEIEQPIEDFDIIELFWTVFAPYKAYKKQIELIESILFLSMIPLHSEDFRHQQAMLCTALQLADRVVDIRSGEEESRVK